MNRSTIIFNGKIIDRSKGKLVHGSAKSSKELMEVFPAWTNFILSFTGWSQVEPGTLTLEDVRSMPLPRLSAVTPLGIEPADLFRTYRRDYYNLLQRRGERRFFGAVIRANKKDHVAVASQQKRPASNSRLEVYSDVRLRDALCVRTGDEVSVEIIEADLWGTMFPQIA